MSGPYRRPPRASRMAARPEDDEADGRIAKVRSVRLVPVDDPAYLAAMAEQALAHRRFGPKEEQSAGYRVSGRIEEVVRTWLGRQSRLLPERIVAAEVLRSGARAYEPLYLELDAVQVVGAPDPVGPPAVRVYEIKFTSNPAAILRGFRQLRRAARLLRLSGSRVEEVVAAVQAHRGVFPRDDSRLAELAWLRPQDVGRASLPGRALLPLAIADLGELLEDEDRALLETAQDEADANVGARRERDARRAAGEEVAPVDRAAREGAHLRFGDEDEPAGADSPFAALRRLLEPEDR
ncbi:MAG TPA: hypothetical protein VFK38_06465 [Candidatus Limnocylindrales bacterium]|nr:hypothetical protein [Candidatus Limnocylindrales bacterium]